MKQILIAYTLVMSTASNARTFEAISNADSAFIALMSQSDCIVKATVVEQGRGVRFDGMVSYCKMRCYVNESFKGCLTVGDTITIQYTEFGFSGLGGKFSSATGDSTQLITPGKTLVFMLKQLRLQSLREEVIYVPTDEMLGMLEPTTHLLAYLRWFGKQND